MKRLIKLAAALYPARWRAEYGEEFDGVIGNVRPGWRTFANVLGGAMAMQIADRADWLKWMAATAAVGTALACGFSFATQPAMYASVAMLQVNPVPDPVRPAPSPSVLRERAADHLAGEEQGILSRTSLEAMITAPALDLYKDERARVPMEALVERMRRDIHIRALPPESDSDTLVRSSLTFDYPDAAKAQAVTKVLVAKFTRASQSVNRAQTRMYMAFWNYQTYRGAAKSVPPPPTGEDLVVVSEPSVPAHSEGQNRIGLIAIGTALGGMLGLLFSMARRKRHGGWLLAGAAAAGFLVAGAISLLVPVRYTLTAVLRVMPAEVMEDPLATPPLTDADALLRHLRPQIVKRENPDLRIALLPPTGVPGRSGAFRISFTASDPQKARDTVRELVTEFTERNVVENRARALQGSDIQQQIEDHKAGENLEVLDPSSVPAAPPGRFRVRVAIEGFALGLLLGALALFLLPQKRPQAKLV